MNASYYQSNHEIIYNNHVLEFQIIRTLKRRKTNEILVEYGNVSLRTSMSTSINEIETLMNRKAKWILQKIREQDYRDAVIKKLTYKDNSTLPYLGKNCLLKIIQNNSTFIKFINDEFIIYTNRRNVKSIYEQWLFDNALLIFDPIIKRYSRILNVLPKKILIKKLKSRWGSATSNNTINLNIHLLKTPLDVLEYVILHELSHLIERNHSYRFWKIVSDNMTDYKDKIKWLKINAPYLL